MVSVRSDETATRLEEIFSLPSSGQPVWLSDDDVLFLADTTGVPQVWRLSLESGDVAQLTDYPERVQTLLASPQSRRVVFGMDRGGNERQQLWLLDPDSAETRQLTTAEHAIHEPGQLSPDGRTLVYRSNERDIASFDVMLLDLDDEECRPRRVLEDTRQLMPMDVTDGGARVLVKRMVSNLDADLLLLEPATGDVRLLNERDDEAWILDARFGPDGQSAWLLTNAGGDLVRLERHDLTDGSSRVVVKDDWDVELFSLEKSGATLAYSGNRDGYSALSILQVDRGDTQEVSGLSGGVCDRLAWSPSGQHFVAGWSRPDAPSIIRVVRRDGAVVRTGGARDLDLSGFSFACPEIVRFTTFDDRPIPALWFTPASASPWPVIVDVHGGPESQRRPAFTPLTQFFVGEGYAVLAPNVRGSTGYGKAYSHLDDVERRMDAVADLEAAHRWLTERTDVRHDAIVVMGQSYGGFMTLAALTAYPELWAAGVDVVGIANFVTFLERTGAWRRALRAAEYGDLDSDRPVLERNSPLAKVGRLTAPLIVIHGRNDPRVPLHEAEQIVAALRARGRDVELLVFDDEGHGLSKRSSRIQGYGAVARFLRRTLDERDRR